MVLSKFLQNHMVSYGHIVLLLSYFTSTERIYKNVRKCVFKKKSLMIFKMQLNVQ